MEEIMNACGTTVSYEEVMEVLSYIIDIKDVEVGEQKCSFRIVQKNWSVEVETEQHQLKVYLSDGSCELDISEIPISYRTSGIDIANWIVLFILGQTKERKSVLKQERQEFIDMLKTMEPEQRIFEKYENNVKNVLIFFTACTFENLRSDVVAE